MVKLTEKEELEVINKSDRERAICDIQELTPFAVPNDIADKVLDEYFIDVEEDVRVQDAKVEIANRIMQREWVERVNTHAGFIQFLKAYHGYEINLESETTMYCGKKRFVFATTPADTLLKFAELGTEITIRDKAGNKVKIAGISITRKKIRFLFKK